MNDSSEVRKAFFEQAQWCQRLGSPFTARLCEALASGLTGDTDIGREILEWRGNPFAKADALPLRVAGALHALARSGEEPELARWYPPAALPEPQPLWQACRNAFGRHAAHVRRYLSGAPQTNEVGRSAVLMAGFLVFAHRFATPVHLFEIGASAGLNLVPDRYRYRFGDATWGDSRASVELAPAWTGNPPPVDARFQVVTRQGSDIAPLDVTLPAVRARLLSYVWPDQTERLARLDAALQTKLAHPTAIEAMEAAAWVERHLPPDDGSRPGGRVLFHSVLWHYLPPDTQLRIETRVAACGAAANSARPFGWLRLELDASGRAALLLSSWPGGDAVKIADSHPHGSAVNYLL